MNSQKQQILDLVHSRFDEAKARSFSFVNYITAFCRGRKLCLFGAGGIGLSTYYRLKGKGLPVALFCDNNPQKINTEIVDGVRCISPDELLANHPRLGNKFMLALLKHNTTRLREAISLALPGLLETSV